MIQEPHLSSIFTKSTKDEETYYASMAVSVAELNPTALPWQGWSF